MEKDSAGCREMLRDGSEVAQNPDECCKKVPEGADW